MLLFGSTTLVVAAVLIALALNGCGSFITLYVSMVLVLLSSRTFLAIARPWLKSWARCPHGVRGGSARDICSECMQLRAAAAERYLIEQAQRELRQARQTIEASAKRVELAETGRLCRLDMLSRDSLLGLTSREFEIAVQQLFDRWGFSTYLTPASADHGRDIVAGKAGRTYVIECKRYAPTAPVGRPAVQKLAGSRQEFGADGAMFVTTSHFTKQAVAAARQLGIELIDGARLGQIVNEMPGGSIQDAFVLCVCLVCGSETTLRIGTMGSCLNGHDVRCRITVESVRAHRKLLDTSRCPLCGAAMVRRAGPWGAFYGCSRYPQCTGTRRVRAV